jgi:hypothetical protein
MEEVEWHMGGRSEAGDQQGKERNEEGSFTTVHRRIFQEELSSERRVCVCDLANTPLLPDLLEGRVKLRMILPPPCIQLTALSTNDGIEREH